MTTERRHRFGRHDRIAIRGAYYNPQKKKRDTHLLMHVVDGVVTGHGITKTDTEINALLKAGHLRHDPDYYSRAATMLRIRHDDSDIWDCDEDELRTIAWRVEWCTRFNEAATDLSAKWRPTRTPEGFETFVAETKDAMDKWYREKFEERRRPGRKVKGEERKAFDWPGGSTLRGWLILYEEDGCRMRALRPKYANCGNRDQLNPRIAEIVRDCVQNYASSSNPSKVEIHDEVCGLLIAANVGLPEDKKLKVSTKAVNRRIKLLDPLLTDLGRKGVNHALQGNVPIGMGQRPYRPLERIEMDDWECDLFALLSRSSTFKKLPEKIRNAIPRVRCTLTAGIDVATRCLVGLNVSPLPPSTSGSRVALRSMMVDKNPLAVAAGCKKDWPMHGGLGFVCTDGGSPFGGDYNDTVREVYGGRRRPDHDKRMRGYVESYFKTIRRVCRFFAGQTFANVVARGDYKSEDMASVIFSEFRKAVIRFAVDFYHMRPHRGLEGRTPYGVWNEWNAREGVNPAPPEALLRRAFGLRGDYAIDLHGISIGKLSYNDPKLGVLRMVAKGLKVCAIQDGQDLGWLAVKVPVRIARRFAEQAANMGIELGPDETKWLDVPCVDARARGLTIDEVIASDAAVRKLAREQDEAGKPIRYGAVLDLVETGERARREAGLPTFVPTQAEYAALVTMWKQKTKAAFAGPVHAEEPIDPDDPDSVGQRVAVSTRTKPRQPQPGTAPAPGGGTKRRPFGGSLNIDQEDEE